MLLQLRREEGGGGGHSKRAMSAARAGNMMFMQGQNVCSPQLPVCAKPDTVVHMHVLCM